MGTASISRPARVARISRWMAVLCVLFTVGLPVVIGFYVFAAPDRVVAEHDLASMGITILDRRAQIIIFAMFIITSVPMIWGLLQLRGLFQRYAVGEVFSRAASGYLSRFGLALILDGVAGNLGRSATAAALTWQNPPGKRYLVFGIGTDDVSVIFIGVTFMVIAWVMAEAAAMAEENKSFV